MSTRITVGVSRKLGQPDYGSTGASCHIDFEIGGDPLQTQNDQLAVRIREAFHLCRCEVERELTRDKTPNDEPPWMRTTERPQQQAKKTPTNGYSQTKIREATEAQIRAIHAIASKAKVHLASQLESDFGVIAPKQLTIRQASELIETLKGRLEAS